MIFKQIKNIILKMFFSSQKWNSISWDLHALTWDKKAGGDVKDRIPQRRN